MVINNKELVIQLEGVINRLEDVVFDNTAPYDADEEELQEYLQIKWFRSL